MILKGTSWLLYVTSWQHLLRQSFNNSDINTIIIVIKLMQDLYWSSTSEKLKLRRRKHLNLPQTKPDLLDHIYCKLFGAQDFHAYHDSYL